MRLLHRWVDAFVAPSSFVATMLVRAGYPAERVHVLRHGVPIASTPSTVGDYGLYVGRLSPEKGIRTLLAASRLVPTVPVCIAGRGRSHLPFSRLRERLSDTRGPSIPDADALRRGRRSPLSRPNATRALVLRPLNRWLWDTCDRLPPWWTRGDHPGWRQRRSCSARRSSARTCDGSSRTTDARPWRWAIERGVRSRALLAGRTPGLPQGDRAERKAVIGRRSAGESGRARPPRICVRRLSARGWAGRGGRDLGDLRASGPLPRLLPSVISVSRSPGSSASRAAPSPTTSAMPSRLRLPKASMRVPWSRRRRGCRRSTSGRPWVRSSRATAS